MNRYKKWASREYSLKNRLLALIPAGFLFVLILPYLLVILLPRLDELLQLPELFFGTVNYIVGIPLILIGGIYGFWSIYSQLSRASGTPLPMMPTQKLLIDGPFKQCRNPMTFGTITAYLGVGIMVGSLSSIVLVIIIGDCCSRISRQLKSANWQCVLAMSMRHTRKIRRFSFRGFG